MNYIATDTEKALIRSVGGIVHSDGNIFFTDYQMFLQAAQLASPAAEVAGYEGRVRYDLLYDFAEKHSVPYNELCQLVRKATAHLRTPQEPQL